MRSFSDNKSLRASSGRCNWRNKTTVRIDQIFALARTCAYQNVACQFAPVRFERLSGVGRRELLAMANESASVRVVTASELGIGKTIQSTQVRLGNTEIRRQIREMKILHTQFSSAQKNENKNQKKQRDFFRTLSRFSCAVSVALSSTLSSGAHAVCKASRDVAKRSRATRTASVAAPASVTSSNASNKCVAANTRRRCCRSASSLSKIFKKKKKKKKKKNHTKNKEDRFERAIEIN
jgi:hypothetical protein